MFAVVELLGKDENFCGMIAGNDNNPVLVGNDDVVGGDFDAVAVDRNIHTTETVMTY